ncbi:MAG: hypothetical protein K9J27_07545 [Bacteroidales bacterium]|nr:hypothetical protein [Bacteroidales bacterium]MCF8333493.1 hypothetical protein [Bacteroidales bacterium]
MKAFYSILYAMINSFTGDKVSVGMLMIGDGKVFFDYSQEKLSVIKNLFPGAAAGLLSDSLKNIDNTVKKHNKEKAADELGMDIEKLTGHIFTQRYIDYLATYCQNLLTFSHATPINVEPSSDIFGKLFQKFVGHIPEKKKREQFAPALYNKVQKTLYPRIQSRVNIDKDLTHNEIKNLPYRVKVNFIGQNGFPVAGKVLDLNQRFETSKTHFWEFTSLMKALDQEHEQGKYFLISEEPQQNSKNFELWEHIRKIDFCEYVDTSETGKVEEYLEQHDVQPKFE